MTAHPGYSVLWIDFVNEDETMVTQGRDGIVQFWSKDGDQWTKSKIIEIQFIIIIYIVTKKK
jgi:hypothetical protein